MKYKIDRIRERTRTLPDGTEEEVVKIWFSTDTGYQGTRIFPKKGFDAEKVKQSLAGELKQVGMLYEK